MTDWYWLQVVVPSPLVLYSRELTDQPPSTQREALAVLDGSRSGAGAVPPSRPLTDWGRSTNHPYQPVSSASSADKSEEGAAAGDEALAAAVEALRKLAAAHPENTELQSGMKELGENTGM